jgi:ABC-type branched-subunit amino acid transport system permease subunit
MSTRQDQPTTSTSDQLREEPQPAAVPPARKPRIDLGDRRTVLKRLVASLFAGFVLALMIGGQEGSQTDFGISFREATAFPRLLIFLLIGVAIFAAVTFRPLLMPYVRRPGSVPLAVGFLGVLVAMQLMNWFDPVGKFDAVARAASKTSGLPTPAAEFFGWLGYVLWFLPLVVGGAAIVTRTRWLGWVTAGLGVAGAVIAFVAHSQVVSFVISSGSSGIDHSLGMYMACVSYLVIAVAGAIIARSEAEAGDPRGAIEKVMSWRPGLPIAGIGVALGLIAFFNSAWFAPLQRDDAFSRMQSDFHPYNISQLTRTYISWLGLVLFAVTAVLALVGCYLRQRIVAAVAAVLGLAGLVITFLALKDMSAVGARVAPDFGKTWQNLGAGGWVACIAFSFLAAGGLLAALRARPSAATAAQDVDTLPVHAATIKARRSSFARTALPAALIIALFYPPTLPLEWQSTIVTQIGPYILLTVGLNVVVGWAGLLDLGYIAFYGIGSYVTAYFVGSLPVKPPSWLHLSPLWAIPFAIGACLLAGVLLGAPTLRLRGDYLAIVTLGFGEIIQLIAINADNITGGPEGPTVPPPVFKLGPIHVTFGLDSLPYWYLLLIFVGIVVYLFYRLEGSRIGRGWAAIREDEVAAQASGINTMRLKLLAFAIGASTSGLAGVYFASQVGYFDPTQFTIQNSILIVAFVVFGGMGSLPGAVAGAVMLTWLPQFLKAQVPLDDRQMWIGALLLLMMIYRPAGLIPAKRRAAELGGLDKAASSEVSAVPVSGAM